MTLFAAAICLASAAPVDAALTAPVQVEGGYVAGAAVDQSVTAFRGLPYAAPPVGELRWRAPAPVRRWQGVRAAAAPGPICPQFAPPPGDDLTGISGLEISEDCLNLDLWTGAASAGERRPVMVWFHGGGRGFGAASQPIFNGAALARKGVIVVTVNYRGGPMGLLATPELSRENDRHVSGNYGLLDDIAALKWVRRNIAAFGGDPANVTIFGQSFGSGSVHFLSMSPLAKGLFRRMINESHALDPRDPLLMQVGMKYMPLNAAESDGTTFMQAAGAKSVADLRALPWQQVVEAYRHTTSQLLWTYVVDGYVLPRNFAQTYAAGAQADVDEMGGENRDENGGAPDTAYDLVTSGKAKQPEANNPSPYLGVAGYHAFARKKFGAMADEFLTLYPGNSDREVFQSATAAIRDNARISPWMWAKAFTRDRSKPSYLYFFTKAPPGPKHDLLGVYHGAELRYVFNNPAPSWTAEDRRVADMMSSYWVNFAKTGNPNGAGLPQWAPFDGKVEQTMELGGHFGPIPLADEAKVKFWQRFYASQPAH